MSEWHRQWPASPHTLGVAPHQAKPLTEEDAQAIVEAAGSVQWRKWRLDAALVTVMRDGLLRRSEAASLTWRDIVPAVDGSGRVAIRRSKGDQTGQGALVYIRPATTKLLTAWKNDEERRTKRDLVFGLSDPGSICRRIKRAAKAAGLAGAYSGHSPRIGMAVDLAAAGVELARADGDGPLEVTDDAGALHAESSLRHRALSPRCSGGRNDVLRLGGMHADDAEKRLRRHRRSRIYR